MKWCVDAPAEHEFGLIGVAVGRNGAVYVSNNSISAGAGEVLRITP